MKILGFDTATQTSGIAIIDGDHTLAEARHDASGRNSDLLVAIDLVCKRAGIGPRELDAIAVGAGPGSFTGLRIGMATAKGIAFAAKKPLWAVSSLAALAWDGEQALANQQLLAHVDGAIVAVLDARRSEVFAGRYRHGVLVGDERVMAPAAVAAWVDELGKIPVTFVGDARATYPEVFTDPSWIATTPSGVAVCQLALTGPHVDILTSGAPTYIRPSEAEVLYPDGVPGALRR